MLVDFLSQYGLFLAKTLTFVVALLFILVALFALIAKNKQKPQGTLNIINITQERKALREHLQKETLPKSQWKQWRKKQKNATSNDPLPRLFVLRFEGDIRASQVTGLRESITAIIDIATPHDEVLLVLESMGGMVHSYGLAASQLDRLRQHGLHLTVAIDKVAASGGYMMAVVANTIVAAPFAIVGSIGVVAQMPNFHRFLNKHEIDFELQTAGEYKRTLTLFGKNTDKAREKFQQEIDETHQLFKNFIEKYRPQVNLQQVATGEHWHAIDALGYQLIDQMVTSDSLITAKMKTHYIYELSYQEPHTFAQRIISGVYVIADRLADKWALLPVNKTRL